jgi:hypothetical protein
VVIRAGGDQVQRDPAAVTGHRPLHALLAPVDRTATGDLASARRFADCAVYGQVVEVQADHPVERGQREPQQLPAVPGPLGQPAADGAVRAPGRGDALVAAAMHQRGQHVIEHHPVWDAPTVAAPRMRGGELRTIVCPDQGSELDPQRLGQTCWKQRHGPLQ